MLLTTAEATIVAYPLQMLNTASPWIALRVLLNLHIQVLQTFIRHRQLVMQLTQQGPHRVAQAILSILHDPGQAAPNPGVT